MVEYASVKSFAELFKKYRLRAEFETFASFGDALSEKGYFYEDSIFSHWQKGTRTPTNRKIILTIIRIFVERKAIETREEADEFLAATGLGHLTELERDTLHLKVKSSPPSIKGSLNTMSKIFLMVFILIIGVSSYLFIQTQVEKNYVNASQTVPSAVTEPKKLVIGIDATLEPMEYIENGELIGFDVDLGNHLAEELDADIEFRNIIFDNLFNSLDQRQINMIISAVTIIEERQQKYDFSDSYLNAGQVIITQKENNTIREVTDLKGKMIATQTGTTNEKEAIKHTSDHLVIRYSDFVHATKAVSEGNVDALFTDLPNAKKITSKNANLKIVNDPFTDEYYGIVFIKGDPSVTQVNAALEALRKKGILNELEKKWLN
ncbi:MAG: transporter substrate-binding domain-containing protein [Candidatus Levybacteria bacterium]|nr:transporter substrate-binding domain-containing protein [Candidatus Levybacteria bacterium]